ncbi:MAG: sialate O-acetylesterase [Cyanobacteria bacterium P01_D01_bin.1]
MNRPIIIEAEDLNFDRDTEVSAIDSNASGGRILRVRSGRRDADARTTFNGADGTYNLTLDAYDESDGRGGIRVFVNNRLVNSTTLDQNLDSILPNEQTRVQIEIKDLALSQGDQIRIESRSDQGERPGLDKITFTPQGGQPPVIPSPNGSTYRLTSQSKTWEEAQAEAVAAGGNLVTINDAEEEAFLKQTFGDSEGFWIGINDRRREGQFEWVSGEAVTYTNWAPGEPNDALGNQDYGWINYSSSKQWDDAFSSSQFRGIIEINSTIPPVVPPVTPTSIVIEAEDLNFDSDFQVSTIDRNASGGRILRVRSNRRDADARTTFNGADGTYTLTLDAYDESDGEGGLQVFVNEILVNSTILNQNLNSNRPDERSRIQIEIKDLALSRGDQIRIESRRDRGERPGLDKITFSPQGEQPPVTPTSIVIEAEDLNFDRDTEVSTIDRNASGSRILRVRSGRRDSEASTTFNGADGTYNLTLDAYDENDGRGGIRVFVNNRLVNSTTLNQNLGSNLPSEQTRIQIEIEDLALSQGDQIRIESRANRGERPGLDKITFTPQGGITPPPQADVAITSNGGGDVATINLVEGTTVVTDVDVNVGDENVSYRINAGPDRDLFTINEQTGAISFIDAPDFEAPADADGNNVYQFNILALGATADSQFVSVVVDNDAVDDPEPEDVEIISDGGLGTANISVVEGTTAVTDVNVAAGDDSVSYRINAGPDRDLFTINEQTGVISFVNAPDFDSPSDANGNNIYQINVLASGNGAFDSQFIQVAVVEDADNPPPDLEIVSDDTGAANNGFTTIRVSEGVLGVTDVNVAGSEENVTYRLNAGDDIDLFNINSSTGAISFKQQPDFENPLDADANNIYRINVLATRGSQTDRQFINVIVENEVEPQSALVPVYLLAGQSNLVGAASVSNLSDPSFAQPFAEAQIWSRTAREYVDLQPSFDGRSDRVGASLSFGRRVVENTGEDTYLIEYGLGGTSLAEDWNVEDGEQFELFRDFTVKALDNLIEQGLNYEVKGLVWYQGESDVFDNSFANSYQDNLLGFVDGIRDFYGENLDIAVGLIRSDIPTSLTGNIQTVREAQRAVSIGDANVFAVDTDLLGGSEAVRPNNTIHLNADAQVVLGGRFADVFKL